MFLVFTGGEITVKADSDSPESVLVEAKDRQTLEVMKDSIELAGHAEGDCAEVEIVSSGEGYSVRLSRETFCLFLFFEVMYYISDVDFDSVSVAVSDDVDPSWMGIS